jgi:DNA gyrase subunit A
MDIIPKGEDKGRDVLIVMENGYGKRTKISLYKRQCRGGIGLITAKITPKTGKICSMQVVLGEELDVVMISKAGQIIRLPIHSINRLSRPTQGVILMRLNPGDKVASVTVLEKRGEEK